MLVSHIIWDRDGVIAVWGLGGGSTRGQKGGDMHECQGRGFASGGQKREADHGEGRIGGCCRGESAGGDSERGAGRG